MERCFIYKVRRQLEIEVDSDWVFQIETTVELIKYIVNWLLNLILIIIVTCYMSGVGDQLVLRFILVLAVQVEAGVRVGLTIPIWISITN